MKPGWLLWTSLDHDGGCTNYLPIEPQITRVFGLSLLSRFSRLVGSSVHHSQHLCSSGQASFQQTFSQLNKLTGGLFLWLSSPSNPTIVCSLSNNTGGLNSRGHQSNKKHVTSCIQNLAGLQLGNRIKEEHTLQVLLERLLNSTVGRLWNDIEQHHPQKMLMLASAIIPPFDNVSRKVLADSVTSGNGDLHISGSLDGPYREAKLQGYGCVAVPKITLAENSTEPVTGIKFPTLLEDNTILNSEVLVGMGSRCMRVMLKSLKLYAFGIYIQTDSICEKLGPKYASVPMAELKNCPDFYEDLLREDIHMTVRLVVNYNGLNINTVRDSFLKSLRTRLQKMNPQTDYHCLRMFGSYFTPDIQIPMGATIDFRQTADGQLMTEIDGKLIGAVQSKDLCRAFFDMYIGDPPVSMQTKQDIAQNVAGFIRTC